MAIYFYEDGYYMLSNYSAHAVEFRGKLYPTSEAAYHTGKFDDQAIHEELSAARSPKAAKDIANVTYKHRCRPDWDAHKVAHMEAVIRAKLAQQPEVKEALLGSGDEELIENSPVDLFWGCGVNKDGQNQLGKLWMKLRNELRSDS